MVRKILEKLHLLTANNPKIRLRSIPSAVLSAEEENLLFYTTMLYDPGD